MRTLTLAQDTAASHHSRAMLSFCLNHRKCFERTSCISQHKRNWKNDGACSIMALPATDWVAPFFNDTTPLTLVETRVSEFGQFLENMASFSAAKINRTRWEGTLYVHWFLYSKHCLWSPWLDTMSLFLNFYIKTNMLSTWQETLRVFTFSMWHNNPQIFAHMSPHVNFKTGSVDVPAYVKAWLEKKGSSTETVKDADGAEVEGNYSEVTSGAEVQALSVPTPLAKRNRNWVRDADTALAAVDADIMQTLIDHGDPHDVDLEKHMRRQTAGKATFRPLMGAWFNREQAIYAAALQPSVAMSYPLAFLFISRWRKMNNVIANTPVDELPARLKCIIAPSWTFVWYLCVRFQMRWHRPLVLTSDVFNSSVGDPAIGFVGAGGAPCALYMRGEMSLEDVQSGGGQKVMTGQQELFIRATAQLEPVLLRCRKILGIHFTWDYHCFEHLLCEWRKALSHMPPAAGTEKLYRSSGLFHTYLPYF